MPNPNLLIGPYLRREAVLSSKIEGTQASILDIFQYEAGGVKEGAVTESKGIVEVMNYVDALNVCLHEVKNDKQIDMEMIKTAHSILTTNVRGQELYPGELRTVQNWIGKLGTKIEDAKYVPPPADELNRLMDNFVKFIHNPPGRIPVLVQCALIHYQFEAIHPFGDGNGRIGRLLISVLLAQRKVLDQPLLYLSAYIDQRKEEYYSHLLKVSEKSSWEDWIRFFLEAVITQSKEAASNIQSLLKLKGDYEKKLNSKKVSRSIARIVDYLFSNPIITVAGARKYLGINYKPTKNAVIALKEMGILKEYSGQKEKMYVAEEILSIFS